jgi:hypothetical protein
VSFRWDHWHRGRNRRGGRNLPVGFKLARAQATLVESAMENAHGPGATAISSLKHGFKSAGHKEPNFTPTGSLSLL